MKNVGGDRIAQLQMFRRLDEGSGRAPSPSRRTSWLLFSNSARRMSPAWRASPGSPECCLTDVAGLNSNDIADDVFRRPNI
jgi:hypothetical protein